MDDDSDDFYNDRKLRREAEHKKKTRKNEEMIKKLRQEDLRYND